MIHILQLLLLSTVLYGCANEPQQPAPPPPTIVEVQIDADNQLNQDSTNKSAPVLFRIYQLSEVSNFNAADFFTLMEKEQLTLANTLVNKQELLLKVGESKKISLNPSTDVHAIGLFAAFRQLDSAQWRVYSEITANQSQQIHVILKNNRITIEK